MAVVYTEPELHLTAALRQSVEDILEDRFEESDDFLITWIRYAKYDLQKAESALRKCKKWRKENNIDGICSEVMSKLEKEFPFEMNKFDKEGYPITGMKLDKDPRKALSESQSDFVRYFLKHCELMMAEVKNQHLRTEGKVNKFTCVLDMEGFIFGQLTSSKVISAIKEIASLAENNYPRVIKSLYVINTPKMFKILMNLVKPFLSDDTLSRFKLFGSNKEEWRQALLESISEDQLPSFVMI